MREKRSGVAGPARLHVITWGVCDEADYIQSPAMRVRNTKWYYKKIIKKQDPKNRQILTKFWLQKTALPGPQNHCFCTINYFIKKKLGVTKKKITLLRALSAFLICHNFIFWNFPLFFCRPTRSWPRKGRPPDPGFGPFLGQNRPPPDPPTPQNSLRKGGFGPPADPLPPPHH